MGKIAILFMVGLLNQQITQAQGTMTYVSNLGQSSAGSIAVGSDSWVAAGFSTGTNAGGYTLNSIQMALTDASGSPGDFTVLLYSSVVNSPGINLATLSGSTDPSTAGIFSYAAVSSLMLSQSTTYFIVLTAGTTIANGAFEWSYGRNFGSYYQSGDWAAPPITSGLAYNYESSDGSSWNLNEIGPFQFAINATPVPEPSPSWLLLLGGGVFVYVRRTLRH